MRREWGGREREGGGDRKEREPIWEGENERSRIGEGGVTRLGWLVGK